MKRSCTRCLIQAGRVYEVAPAPSRLVVRPLSTSITLLANDRGPSRRPQMTTRDPTSMQRVLKSSIQNTTTEKPIASESKVDYPELPNEQFVESWTSIGVPEVIARRLLSAFPHIEAPTPAQRAFLLTVNKGKDVYLKDHMGRGKTLAVSIAVASLAYKRARQNPTGIRFVVLLPSTHLLYQVERDLLALDPAFTNPDLPLSPSEDRPPLFSLLAPTHTRSSKGKDTRPTAEEAKEAEPAKLESQVHDSPILLATPKDLIQQIEKLDTSQVSTVFLDEPDTMLPALPSRHLTGVDLRKHPVNRHPPPIVQALNHLLNIKVTLTDAKTTAKMKKRKDVPDLHAVADKSSRRREVQTIWTSGTMDAALRKFTKQRGWVRKTEDIVDLVFTPGAKEHQIEVREAAQDQQGKKVQVRTSPISSVTGVQPDHFALTVDVETGDIDTLSPDSLTVRGTPGLELQGGQIWPTMLEAVALIHTTSPPPPGTYALAVPPEGTSLDGLADELSTLGLPTLHLRPELIPNVTALEPTEDEPVPILVARRSIVAGLHLPKLHTIYMLNGLDATALTKSAGIRERVAFYDIAAGRVGRLGTGQVGGQEVEQRIISLVPKDSRDENMLGELFYGRYSVRAGLEEDLAKGQEVEKKWEVKEWDLEGMREAVGDIVAQRP